MSGRFEYARSGRDKSVLLVFPEGTFEGLPFEVRLAAPWVGYGYGEVSQLKPADRWQFVQAGYAILRDAVAAPALAFDAPTMHCEQASLQQAA